MKLILNASGKHALGTSNDPLSVLGCDSPAHEQLVREHNQYTGAFLS